MFYRLALLIIFSLAAVPPALAYQFTAPSPSEVQAQEKIIAVQVIEGRLVGSFDLVNRGRTESVSLYIDLASPHGLALDGGVIKQLGLDTGKGFVTLKSLDGFTTLVRIKSISALSSEPKLTRISTLFSKELDDRAIVGSIGLGLLGKFHMSFNVKAGRIILSKAASAGRDLSKIEADVTVAISRVGEGGIILPLTGTQGAMLSLSSAQYDTFVDLAWSAQAGYPAGNLPGISLKGERADTELDLSGSMAFKPHEFMETGRVKFISGLNLFLDNIVNIDLVNRIVSFTSLSIAEYPKADFAYFSAMIQDGEEPLLAYLNDHKETRLAPEAARLLLDRRRDRAASDGDMLDAARLVRDTASVRARGGVCLDLMKDLRTTFPDRRALVILVGRLGVEVARHDDDPETLYRLHKMIGLEQLDAGNIPEAWKGLLSAAFGLPRDPMVNYALGRIYEHQDRLKRAQSRYQRALALMAEDRLEDRKVQNMFRQALARIEVALLKEGGNGDG